MRPQVISCDSKGHTICVPNSQIPPAGVAFLVMLTYSLVVNTYKFLVIMSKENLQFSFLAKIMLIGAMSCLGLTSCLKGESDYDKQVKIDDLKIVKYLASKNIQAQKNADGFYYQVLTANPTGAVLKQNDVVSFYYTISLINTVADISSSILPETIILETNELLGSKPLQFKLMNFSIIPEGLDYAVSLMKVGEAYRFFMPSYLAYGSFSSSDFPANSNFIIDIRVVSAKTESDIEVIQRDSIEAYVKAKYATYNKLASGLFFVDSIPGTGRMPNNIDYVTVDYSRKYLNNSVIKSGLGVSFFLNQGQAVQGLEEGIRLMKEGGSAIMIMPSSLAFKQSLCVIPQKTRKNLLDSRIISSDVLPYSILKYVVKLKSVN